MSCRASGIADPQEASTYQPSVRPERRHRIEQELSSTSAAAFQILTAALQQSGGRRTSKLSHPVDHSCHHPACVIGGPGNSSHANHLKLWCTGPNVKMSVCRAFASWLRLTVEPFLAEAAQHLVQMVLQALSSKDTFDSAVDAIVEVIYRTAMWQERKQLSPEWGTMVQAVLQVVRAAAQGFIDWSPLAARQP